MSDFPVVFRPVDKAGINFVEIATKEKQQELIDLFGEVSATPTANTLLSRVKDINDTLASQNNPSRKDENNSTNTPLEVGDTFTGDWTKTDNLSSISFFAFSDQPFDVARLEWSSDGISTNTDLLALADFLIAEELTEGFYVYYPDPQTYLLDKYYRVVLAKSTGTGQTVMSAYTWVFNNGAQPFTFLDPEGVPSTLSKALLTKTINPALVISHFTDEESGNIPSGVPVVIDPVLNTEPNVLDSGWISTESFAGKNTVNAVTDASVQVYLMNASDNQGANIFGTANPTFTTKASIESANQLSALYADNFFRILIVNTSGSALTNYSVRTTAAPESTDGITTSIEADLFGFFPAKVTRTVGVGKNPDGQYTNIESPGFYSEQGTSTPRLAGVEFAPTTWSEVNGYGSQQFAIFGNQALEEDYYTAINGDTGSVLLEVSNDGITKATDFILELGTNPPAETAMFTIAFPYFRVKVAPAVADEAFFVVNVVAYAGAPTAPIRAIDAAFNGRGLALLTKSVTFGRQPDGDYVSTPADGNAFLHDSVNGDPLPVSGDEISSGWIKTDGFKEIEFGVSTDAVATISVSFSGTIDSPTPTPIGQPFTFDYNNAAIAAGQLIEKFGPNYDGVKIDVEIGDDDPSFFVFSVELRNTPSALPQSAFTASIQSNERAVQTRGAIVAPNDALQFENIGRDGEGSGLNAHITGSDVESTIAPVSAYSVGQISVGTASAVRIPGPTAMSVARSLSMTNPSDSVSIYWGGSNVTAATGDIILPLSTKDLDLDSSNRPYIIAAGASGTSNTVDLEPNTVDSSSGITTPSDMFTSNDVRVGFNDEADTATLSGFDATGGVSLDIQTVRLVLEGRKEPGAATETVVFDDVADGTAGGYGNALSATVSSVPLVTGGYYLVSFSRRDENADVTNVTNTMGFTGYTILGDTGTAALESRTTVIAMTGTPTSTGSITIQTDTGFDHAAACVTIFDNVASAAITDTDTFASSSSSTYSGSLTGTENGLFVMSIGSEITTHSSMTAPTGSSQRHESGSTSSNDQTLHVRTAPVSATGTINYSGTMTGSSDVTAVAVTLEPSDALNPIVVVSHSEGSTELEVTLDNETDETFEIDITGDAAWTTTLIDNMVVTVSPTLVGNAAAQIDFVGVSVIEVSDATRVTYAWVGDS